MHLEIPDDPDQMSLPTTNVVGHDCAQNLLAVALVTAGKRSPRGDRCWKETSWPLSSSVIGRKGSQHCAFGF